MKLDAQGARDLQNCGEARIAIGAQRAIQALSAESRVLGNLRHPLRTSDIAKGASNSGGVIRRLVQPRVQIRGHFRWCAQLFGDVISGRFGPRARLGFGLYHLDYSS